MIYNIKHLNETSIVFRVWYMAANLQHRVPTHLSWWNSRTFPGLFQDLFSFSRTFFQCPIPSIYISHICSIDEKIWFFFHCIVNWGTRLAIWIYDIVYNNNQSENSNCLFWLWLSICQRDPLGISIKSQYWALHTFYEHRESERVQWVSEGAHGNALSRPVYHCHTYMDSNEK